MAHPVKNPLDAAVTCAADGTWTFECPNVAGSPCGEPDGRGFLSSGWPDKSHALDRGRQHFDEHLGKGVSQEMADFMADRGLTTTSDGRCVKLEDLA
mgnify:CR=1 FL=1